MQCSSLNQHWPSWNDPIWKLDACPAPRFPSTAGCKHGLTREYKESGPYPSLWPSGESPLHEKLPCTCVVFRRGHVLHGAQDGHRSSWQEGPGYWPWLTEDRAFHQHWLPSSGLSLSALKHLFLVHFLATHSRCRNQNQNSCHKGGKSHVFARHSCFTNGKE